MEREAAPELEPSRGPAFHDFVEPPIFPDLRITHDTFRTPDFILARKNVTLTGYRAFTDDRGRFHVDESYPTSAMRAVETEHFGSEQFHMHEASGLRDAPQIPGAYTLNVDGRPVIQFEEPVVFLGSNEAPNFGSFMYRILPKAVALSHLDPDLKIVVPLYPDALRNHLVALGVAPSRIVRHDFEKVYKFRQVFMPSMRNRTLWMDPSTRGLFEKLRRRATPAGKSRRLFVTRLNMPKAGGGERIMINEAEVRSMLAEFGFEIVAPETMTIDQQISTFVSASHIVAAGGSALYNAAFCEPGTKYVDIEAEPFWGRGHIRWLDSAGLQYGVFEGTPSRDFSVPHQPFTVDVTRLRDRLQSFI